MGIFDDLIPSAANGAAEADRPEGYDPQSGTLRITVRPKGVQAPPAQPPVSPAARDLLIRTVVGEAANQPDDGQAAVAHVIMNRLGSGRFGNDIPNVVLAPNQFEPWQAHRAALAMLPTDAPAYQKAASIVDGVLSGDTPDPTGGATHFLNEDIVRQRRGGSLPAWAQGDSVKIGAHTFYNPGGQLTPPDPSRAVTDVSSQNRSGPSGMFDDLIPQQGSAGLKELSDLTSGFQPQVTGPQAAALGLASGLSANFHDEIVGASNASGLPGWLGGLRAPVGIARLLYEKAIGSTGNASRAYQEGRDAVRALQKAAQQQHPTASLAGDLAGAVASVPLLPEVAIAKGAGLGARTANAAAAGGLYGTISGAGAGEGAADTVKQAVTGGLIGGAGGAVLSPVVEGAGQVIQRAVGGLTAKGRDVIAARQVAGALEKDSPGQTASKAADIVERANQNGVPLSIADTGGTVTRRLADAASIKSPVANKSFNELFDERAGTQKDRLIDQVRTITGGDVDSTLTREALEDAARLQNKGSYARTYAAGDRPVFSPELGRLADAPSVVDAMRAAATKGKDYAINEGMGGFNSAVKVTEDGRVLFNKGPGGVPTYPNIQYWDYVQRELRNAEGEASRAGRDAEASRIGGLRRALNSELDRQVPEFGQTRRGAAAFFGADNALEAGEKFVSSRMGNTEARQAVEKMTPAERQLFAQGFASNFMKSVREVSDRTNIMNRMVNSPAARERIEIALGPDAARRLEAFARIEGMMQKTKDAVSGNSRTMQRYVDSGLAGGGIMADAYSGNPLDPTGASLIVAALTKAGRRTINEKVAQRVGELLSSKDPQALRELLDMAARNPRLLDTIRRADSLLPRILGGQVGDVKLLPSTVPARADDQEQR